jgi:hypothetical protein
MDRRRILRAVGGGLAGFLVMLIPGHAVMVFAMSYSLRIFGGANPPLQPGTVIVGVGIVPLVLAAAAALPAIGLGQSVQRSLIAGYVAGLLAVLAFVVVSPLYPDYWLFSPDDAFASIIPVGAAVLIATVRSPLRIGLVFAMWIVFSALALTITQSSQTVGFIVVLLAWLLIPLTAVPIKHGIDS